MYVKTYIFFKSDIVRTQKKNISVNVQCIQVMHLKVLMLKHSNNITRRTITCMSYILRMFKYFLEHILTGYNQSVTGCGSQRRQCSCYSMKTRVNSMILIFKLNLTSLRNIYIKSGVCHHTHFNVFVSQGSQIQFEDKIKLST